MFRSTPYQVVVITGANAGVGRAAAHAFARRGARVALLARDVNGLEKTAEEVRRCGGEALVIAVDVADAEQIEAAASRVERELGAIDVWVNNAMATIYSPFAEVVPEDFRRVTEVTYLGYVWGTRAALQCMVPRNRGTVIQVGSALAYRSIPLQSAYCGAKAAIRGFTDAIRSELIHDHSRVHITMVQLPAINTPQFDWAKTTQRHRPRPVAPVFQPELAAAAIEWSARHRRRELVLGFSSLKAIWGNVVAAGMLDHYLARAAYSGQRSDEWVSPTRQDNLWQPVPDKHATHGRFDDEAKQGKAQLVLSTQRHWLIGSVLLAAAVCLRRHFSLRRKATFPQRRE